MVQQRLKACMRMCAGDCTSACVLEGQQLLRQGGGLSTLWTSWFGDACAQDEDGKQQEDVQGTPNLLKTVSVLMIVYMQHAGHCVWCHVCAVNLRCTCIHCAPDHKPELQFIHSLFILA